MRFSTYCSRNSMKNVTLGSRHAAAIAAVSALVDALWKCTIREAAGRTAVSRCYVVHESKVETIVRGVECA